MKKIVILISLLLLGMLGFSQQNGNFNNLGFKKIYYNGGTYQDSLISKDSLHAYHYRLMANPKDSMDGVNKRYLESAIDTLFSPKDTLSKLATQDDIKSMISGTGTAGYISQFTAAKTIDTTGLYWNGKMGIGTTNPNDGNLVVNSATGGSIVVGYNDSDGSIVNKATLQATSTGGLNITTLSGVSVNADDITVTNKNKYRPLLAYGSDVILRYQDFIWNGSAYVASNGYGFGGYALQNNTGTYSNGFGGAALQNNTGTYSNGFGGYALQNNTGVYSNGFGGYALQNNIGIYSSGFGSSALRYNTGIYSSGFGSSALQNNNWANVLSFGHQSTSYFLANAATDKAFAKASIDSIAHTITFSGAHGFGATNAKVNLKYTLTAGISPTGLVTTTIYQFTITSPTVLTYSGITGTGSSDFEGKLTNSVDINNSIAIGNDVNASKANQVVLGKSTITETQLFGKIGINTSAPDATVEVNSATGGSIALTYNDSDGSAANKATAIVTATGDLTVTPTGGDVSIVGDLAYDFIHAIGSADSIAYTTSGSTQNIYYKINTGAFTSHEADGMTITGDSIKVLKAGDYKIHIWLAATTSNANDYMRVKLFSNNVANATSLGRFIIRSEGTGLTTQKYFMWYKACAADEWLSWRIANLTGARASNITDIKIYIEKVPEN